MSVSELYGKNNYIHHYHSPLGGITIASNGECLIGLWFDGQKYFADTIEDNAIQRDLPIFDQTDKWLDIYFSGKAPDFTPPLLMKTTTFRKKVWEIMLTIPFGQTMTYGQIADKIAREKGLKQMSAQATKQTLYRICYYRICYQFLRLSLLWLCD